MINRYTRAAMGKIWTDENRFKKMLVVEKAVAKAQADLKLIPRAAAEAIDKKGRFSLEKILELEATTKHDVIAFVSNVAENVGEWGRFVHFGMTSSDVLDTALSLQIRDAGAELTKTLEKFKAELRKMIRKHSKTLCAGRTHGMHAEPTTFGFKLAGYYEELERNELRLNKALEGIRIGKLSGAVGTYSAQSPKVEDKVCKALELKPEPVATQVIARDRHAELFMAFAILAGSLERLAVELRHLQRTEVGEVIESFTPGQKGSSAMPHKKNPISSENITGCCRLIRSYSQASLENIALWHERDISHSSVERVIFGDAFILLDYAIDRMTQVLKGLYVDTNRMLKNIELSQGTLFSSHLLLALVEAGLTRENAYKIVQELSHGLKKDQSLHSIAAKDSRVKDLLSSSQLKRIFSGARHIEGILEVLKKRELL